MKPYHWHENNTLCDTWFERDRAMVRLTDMRGNEILCLWDEQVAEFAEDGFKRSRETWHEALCKYANGTEINGEVCMKQVLNSYLETALWSSTDDAGEPLDRKYTIEDFAEETVARATLDIETFLAKAPDLSDLDLEIIGHDLWLTQNRHGAGFWDGDYDLTDLAHALGEQDIYVGDDGRLHFARETV